MGLRLRGIAQVHRQEGEEARATRLELLAQAIELLSSRLNSGHLDELIVELTREVGRPESGMGTNDV